MNAQELTNPTIQLLLGHRSMRRYQDRPLPMEAVLHRERYIDDVPHRSHLEEYDQAMVDFYTSQQMHSNEPRWTRTMAGRVERFAARAELDVFLREQGFNQKSNP